MPHILPVPFFIKVQCWCVVVVALLKKSDDFTYLWMLVFTKSLLRQSAWQNKVRNLQLIDYNFLLMGRKTAPRLILIRTLSHTCGVKTSDLLSRDVAPRQPWLKSSRLRCLGFPSGEGLPPTTIHFSRTAQACNHRGVGYAVLGLHQSGHRRVASPAGICSPATRRTYRTLFLNGTGRNRIFCVFDSF